LKKICAALVALCIAGALAAWHESPADGGTAHHERHRHVAVVG
jgi:hypothetical protein